MKVLTYKGIDLPGNLITGMVMLTCEFCGRNAQNPRIVLFPHQPGNVSTDFVECEFCSVSTYDYLNPYSAYHLTQRETRKDPKKMATKQVSTRIKDLQRQCFDLKNLLIADPPINRGALELVYDIMAKFDNLAMLYANAKAARQSLGGHLNEDDAEKRENSASNKEGI